MEYDEEKRKKSKCYTRIGSRKWGCNGDREKEEEQLHSIRMSGEIRRHFLSTDDDDDRDRRKVGKWKKSITERQKSEGLTFFLNHDQSKDRHEDSFLSITRIKM